MSSPAYYARLERMQRHHKAWLWLCCGRCCITFRKIGRHGGDYHPYEMHHGNYDGDRLFWNVLPLDKKFHTKFIHGTLSGGLSAGEQRRKYGKYPNGAQSLLHWWGRVVLLCLITWRLKWEVAGLVAIGYIVYALA